MQKKYFPSFLNRQESLILSV